MRRPPSAQAVELEKFTPFLRFDTRIHRTVCATNAIESVNARQETPARL
ncbi:hypothetical protein SLI_3828 [Streptomyces lividans 1326]|uniref:Transposase n=1 Tax=Streptomyces lividans 1326 TaxID=1200984 RepID=A0A7U9DR07_STRLI|nr:hypothetical protein SLI_3828 [Streptomyces lividans 1326]